MRHLNVLVALLAVAIAPSTRAASLQPALSGVAFLVGVWTSPAPGRVADTGGRARGDSRIEVAAGGAALLRRDHTELLDANGKPGDSFDQVMLVYSEGGTLHADYADGQHVIHYTSASIEPGRSVVFATDARPDAPRFRLGYRLQSPGLLGVSFAMAPPGGEFQSIATGTLRKLR